MRPSETRIPDVPNQTAFLERWYNWHRGYRIVKHDDGREERQIMLGESLEDTAIGHLPRTLNELRSGTVESLSLQEGSITHPTRPEPESLDIEPEDRLFDSPSPDDVDPNNDTLLTFPLSIPVDQQNTTARLTELETQLRDLEIDFEITVEEDVHDREYLQQMGHFSFLPQIDPRVDDAQDLQLISRGALNQATLRYHTARALLARARRLRDREVNRLNLLEEDSLEYDSSAEDSEHHGTDHQNTLSRANEHQNAYQPMARELEQRRENALNRFSILPFPINPPENASLLSSVQQRSNGLERGTLEPVPTTGAVSIPDDQDRSRSYHEVSRQTLSFFSMGDETADLTSSNEPWIIQREALGDDEFLHDSGYEIDEDGDTLEVENKGLDKDGRPEALKEEQLLVKLECKVCYTQLANVAVTPCGEYFLFC